MDSNFGLESFEEYAAKNRDVRRDVLRERYDKAIEERKQEQIRENLAARERRLRAEADAKKERVAEQRAEDRRRREAHEAELKERARASWTGTPEAFETAWPRMLEDKLIEESNELERRARASKASMYNVF
jgi:hypothetical protein